MDRMTSRVLVVCVVRANVNAKVVASGSTGVVEVYVRPNGEWTGVVRCDAPDAVACF